MKTVRLTMAQALVRFLENQYVRYDEVEHRFVRGIFMLPGHGNVVGLGQAIQQESKELEVYHGKNEQGQAQAAMAFAKQMHRKQIFACTSSVGPGAANMVTAAANATANNIPLLLLPGDVYVSRQPDPVLQQIEQPQELTISTNDAFRPVCRYWDRIVRPEQLMTAMLSALRVLTDPADTGAVCIALPQDTQAEAYDYPVSFFEKRVHRIERRPPAPYAVAEAVAAIRGAKRPILVCGGGVRYSEAGETFRAFAEAHNIPFGETQAGKSAVVWTHPLNLGGIGVTGCSAANDIAKDADVVIGVGTRYTDFTTASKWLFPASAKYVNINVSEFQAYKLDAIRVVADARLALEAVSAALAGYRAPYGGEIEAARAKWQKELNRLDAIVADAGYVPEVHDENSDSWKRFAKDVGSTFTQTRALGLINAHIAKDAVVIGASGSLPGDMQRMWRPNTPNTYNMEYGYSCMGYEVSGALGVKLAIGENREVYAMTGDGSFNMLHSELITSVQEGRKINVMLFDNASFGCINNLQVGQGNDTMCTELRKREGADRLHHTGPFLHIDYAGVARAYGCKAYTVTTAEELVAAIEDAKQQKGSTLIDIKVLPKSMTEGYGGWWRVGVAEVSERARVQAARKELESHLEDARRY
ncbi:MAG: 3D-(3,5/4)-trihydroxycyclohexane-1,2-dione acylhydrolase (decyclizing) [Christensenellaceae bacterium]|jgi:3D-(3,5/4)-trihydroxycyclohexane-1,2-dione acylhydrolase (decyclizing)|nr:3D-(3,5/4)-trihydroxycyclohexane-1,2-dione acylhydrolase (decyclizing) [Christensenellaceae bacterium]